MENTGPLDSLTSYTQVSCANLTVVKVVMAVVKEFVSEGSCWVLLPPVASLCNSVLSAAPALQSTPHGAGRRAQDHQVQNYQLDVW